MSKIKYETGFEEGIIYQGFLWTVAVKVPRLCKINLENYDLDFSCKIPCKAKFFSYEVVAREGNKLILMPICAEHILEYDIEKNCFTEIKLKKALKTNGTKGGATFKFRSFARCGDILWMMPQASFCFVEYNIKTHELIEHTMWYKDIKGLHAEEEAIFAMGIQAEESLWLPCHWTNAVLEFSIRTKQAKMHYFGATDTRFDAITYADNTFWLVDNIHRSLFSWDGNKNVQLEAVFPDDYALDKEYKSYASDGRGGIVRICVKENAIILLPHLTNYFMEYDINRNRFNKLWAKTEGMAYKTVYFMADETIFVPQSGNEIVSLVQEKAAPDRTKVSIPVDTTEVSENNLFTEKFRKAMPFFLSLIKEDEKAQEKRLSKGTQIYNNLVKR